MAQPRSAGVLLFRQSDDGTDVLLILPGGPYWRGRDVGAWQIPKGAIEDGEDAVTAAARELGEELGVALDAPPRPLCSIRQAGGKQVEMFAAERDWDVAALISAEVEVVWPPRSGRTIRIPEVAEARWFPIDTARDRILPSQRPALDALAKLLAGDRDPPPDKDDPQR